MWCSAHSKSFRNSRQPRRGAGRNNRFARGSSSSKQELLANWQTDVASLLVLAGEQRSGSGGRAFIGARGDMAWYYARPRRTSLALTACVGSPRQTCKEIKKATVATQASVTIALTFCWSPLLRRSVYNKTKVKFMYKSNQMEHNRTS